MTIEYPACVCVDHYPDASPVHPPDCPVRQTIDRLRALVAQFPADVNAAYERGFHDGERAATEHYVGEVDSQSD